MIRDRARHVVVARWRPTLIVTLLGGLLWPATTLGVAPPADRVDEAVQAGSVSARPLGPTTIVASGVSGVQQPAPTPAALDLVMGDWELQEVPWSALRLNGGPLLRPRTEGATDGRGLPKRPPFKGAPPAYNPTVLAQQGMKRLDSWKRTGRPVHLREARRIARKLDQIALEGGRRRWQPHPYDQGTHARGWVNANSHGLVLSFFSRYHALTGDDRHLERAHRLFAAFERRPDHRRWFTYVTRKGLVWFEHWPDGRYERTLNGHLNALFGLYDYWLETRSPLAEQYFRAGTATVRETLQRFRRRGRLSRYSLGSDKASLHYHHTHIHQLRVLALLTGDEWFARQAARLVADERAWRRSRS